MEKYILCILVKSQLSSFSHELFNPTNPSPPALTLGVLCSSMYLSNHFKEKKFKLKVCNFEKFTAKFMWHLYSVDSIIRTVSIKRTVWKNFHMTLLNVPYDLKVALKINKRTVSIKRTVWHFCVVFITNKYFYYGQNILILVRLPLKSFSYIKLYCFVRNANTLSS